jgi:hypothetical protein
MTRFADSAWLRCTTPGCYGATTAVADQEAQR